ncbi:hypothetical protein RclHR1_13530006 [Rhizophagus clarus]|uniref:Uncharacterized protein n=1 Tax=Rhizophagus clarus TaxID=94130 RepID=A0A2Z6QA89_9GLOM|nr:hypothetical protein RclHR1_13530006 [Rhizophagus clarus]
MGVPVYRDSCELPAPPSFSLITADFKQRKEVKNFSKLYHDLDLDDDKYLVAFYSQRMSSLEVLDLPIH